MTQFFSGFSRSKQAFFAIATTATLSDTLATLNRNEGKHKTINKLSGIHDGKVIFLLK
jgi:hypothetical protein